MRLDGLLLEGVLPRDPRKDLTFGEKLAGLPVVNLLVRKSPPVPPSRGGYFSWKQESPRPWVSVAMHGNYHGEFSTLNGDGPTPGLLSLSF
jgi:hypothetical protein